MIPSNNPEISTETTRELTSDELDAVSAGALQAYIHVKGQKSGDVKVNGGTDPAVTGVAVAVVKLLK